MASIVADSVNSQIYYLDTDASVWILAKAKGYIHSCQVRTVSDLLQVQIRGKVVSLLSVS